MQFITSHMEVKIGDFGLSRIVNTSITTATQAKGTPGYLAPEIAMRPRKAPPPDYFAADVYSCAMIFWELLALESLEVFAREYGNANALIIAFANGDRPDFPADFSKKHEDLIQRMWQNDPKKRPTLEDIANELQTSVAPL